MTTQIDPNNDPYAAAMAAEENNSRTYFGQITVDSWFCVLEKGVGKRPFDPNADKIQDRKTCIQMFLEPVSVARFTDVIQRDMVAEFGKDWLKICRPSLAAIGHDLRSIHMQWVEVEMVQYGTFTNKNNEEKTLTAFKFVRVFTSEDEANAAYNAFYSGGAPTPAPGSYNADGTPTNGGNGGDKQREVAAKFLAPLWKIAAGDPTKFAEAIAKNPVTSRFFDINSPEALAVISPF